jgi:predicted DsbA family dithiol-disulfide isomerase
MHDAMFANGGKLGEDDLVRLARRLGLDTERFRAELRSGAHAPRVARDAESARAAGVTSTPGFFINGERYEDAYDAGSLVAALTSDPQIRD